MSECVCGSEWNPGFWFPDSSGYNWCNSNRRNRRSNGNWSWRHNAQRVANANFWPAFCQHDVHLRCTACGIIFAPFLLQLLPGAWVLPLRATKESDQSMPSSSVTMSSSDCYDFWALAGGRIGKSTWSGRWWMLFACVTQRKHRRNLSASVFPGAAYEINKRNNKPRGHGGRGARAWSMWHILISVCVWVWVTGQGSEENPATKPYGSLSISRCLSLGCPGFHPTYGSYKILHTI